MRKPTPAAERASRSSFYTGMRILPRAQREAMFEIYSFCRAVDDIADDLGPREPRREQLAHWRSDIDAVYRGAPPPQLGGLASAVRKFDLQRDDFIAIIDGMDMDVIAGEQKVIAVVDRHADRGVVIGTAAAAGERRRLMRDNAPAARGKLERG